MQTARAKAVVLLERAALDGLPTRPKTKIAPTFADYIDEFGQDYTITPALALVAGVFSIRKPYYNLDPTLRYRQLGTLENRGIEVSSAVRADDAAVAVKAR